MGQTELMQIVSMVSRVNGDDLETVMTTTNYMENTTSTSKTYYKDGWLYGDQDGVTFKAQLTMEQMYAIVYGADAATEEKILNMPESWFKDAVFVQNEDDTYSIRILLDGDKVAEVIDRLGIADMADMGMEISDLCYDIALDTDGNFRGIGYTFSMTMDMDGETLAILSESFITYSGIGTTTVTLPNGCADYVDVTDQLINSIA
jgi:asparagine N-glycosylation enzyme membrane subunit Stt3